MTSRAHTQTSPHADDPSSAQALFESIYSSPKLYLSALDATGDTMVFVPMSPETYRSSDFLDERMHRSGGSDVTIDLKAFIAMFDRFKPDQKSLSFIFHTGYCCSTLLARCLEGLNHTLVLKEPAPLRMLSRSWGARSQPWDQEKLIRLIGTLLSRRFGCECVVVKTTSYCINMMPELVGLHPDNKAVFLYSGLEESLACFLKDPLRRKEARFYLSHFGGLVSRHLPLEPRLGMIDAQIVTLLWLVQIRYYCQIAESLPGGRILALNCNQILDRPAFTLERVAAHFGISAAEETLRDVLESNAFKRYAKGQHIAFDGTTRRAHLDSVKERYSKEIDFASEWAKNLPIWSGIPVTLPNELNPSAQ